MDVDVDGIFLHNLPAFSCDEACRDDWYKPQIIIQRLNMLKQSHTNYAAGVASVLIALPKYALT